MSDIEAAPSPHAHSHVFLADDHDANERRTWTVIWLCVIMMVAEIIAGVAFGSIALVADGMHMSTHAGAMLLAALAYKFSRKHAHDPRFSFGTGKVGDLAGFTSAIVLAMIALLIGYESVLRLLWPVTIEFKDAIPIAVLGLAVNLFSAWLLSRAGGHHGHAHSHGHSHHEHDHEHDEAHAVATRWGQASLTVFEDSVPPRFRLTWADGEGPGAAAVELETQREDGARQLFHFADRGRYLESTDEIPEPHAFTAHLKIAGDDPHAVVFEEHAHDHTYHVRDNNLRAAIVHVAADAAVSVLVIVGLALAWTFGWLWMDPVAGLVGAVVIALWSYSLIRDTGAILLDMTPDARLAKKLRQTVEAHGDEVTDLHLWRLGPGHLGAIVCIATRAGRDSAFYQTRLGQFRPVSHLSIEMIRAA